jgi:predicted nucleic acid-binding Zn finger protein
VVKEEKKKETELEKAMKLISGDKIAKINPKDVTLEYHYIVTGSKDDYLVILPDFCTCEHFILRCLKVPGQVCYHILATRMVGEVRTLELDNWLELLQRVH